MIDIKYHTISLIAVFLALAVGIFLGSSIAPSTTSRLIVAVKQQSSKVEEVIKEYDRDHAVLGRLEDAIASLTPPLVHNKLLNRRVAIIQSGDQPDATRAAVQAISDAGGTVASTTTLTPVYDELTDDDVTRIRTEMPEQPSSRDPEADLLIPIATALRQGAPDSGQIDGALAVMRRERLITTDGDYSKPVSMVVVVGGTGSDTDLSPEPLAAREGEMIDELTNNSSHLVVVGAEVQNAANTSLTTFRNSGIATVDCIDLALGRLDLIYALNGDKANFGVRPTADHVLPASVRAGLEALETAPPATSPTTPPAGFGVGH